MSQLHTYTNGFINFLSITLIAQLNPNYLLIANITYIFICYYLLWPKRPIQLASYSHKMHNMGRNSLHSAVIT